MPQGNFHQEYPKKSSSGSGSTSWYFNINKMTDHCVSSILDIASKELASTTLGADKSLIRRIRDIYNSRLLFTPDCESNLPFPPVFLLTKFSIGLTILYHIYCSKFCRYGLLCS